jgi:hypothetical protein
MKPRRPKPQIAPSLLRLRLAENGIRFCARIMSSGQSKCCNYSSTARSVDLVPQMSDKTGLVLEDKFHCSIQWTSFRNLSPAYIRHAQAQALSHSSKFSQQVPKPGCLRKRSPRRSNLGPQLFRNGCICRPVCLRQSRNRRSTLSRC